MKTNRTIITLIATVFTAAIFNTAARADDIGNGSIRVTLSAETAADLKVRYVTEGGTVEQSIAADEVLHLSSFSIEDNGDDFPALYPQANQFNVAKEGSTGYYFAGDNDDSMVRLSFEKAGLHEELLLDFQWTPKLEILTTDADKVEVLNDVDELLEEVLVDPVQITSNAGMAIRFVVEGHDGDDQNPDNQPNPNEGDDGLDDAPEAGATGGCSMVNPVGASPMSGLLLVLPALLAVTRRIRRQ